MEKDLRRGFTFWLVALLLIPAAGLTAQDDSVRPACVFLEANFSETNRLDIFRDVIKDALEVELKVARYELVPEEKWREVQKSEGIRDADLVRGPVAVRLARAIGAEVVLTGFIRIEDNEIFFGVKSYDVSTERLSFSLFKEGIAGLQVYNQINDASLELIPGIDVSVERLPAEVTRVQEEIIIRDVVYKHETVEKGREIQVTLRSRDEGAEVYLAGTEYVGMIADGALSFPAKAGTRLILEIRKPGYHDQHREVRLKDEDKRLRIRALKPETHMAFEAEYTSFQFLGAGGAFRYYLRPGKIFLRGEDDVYLSWPFLLPGTKPVFHNDLEAQIGTYLFTQPGSLFRFSVAGGAGLILTKPVVKMPLFTDFYLNIVDLTYELNLRRLAFYYKQEVKYFLGIGNNLLDRGMIDLFGPIHSLGVVYKWK